MKIKYSDINLFKITILLSIFITLIKIFSLTLINIPPLETFNPDYDEFYYIENSLIRLYGLSSEFNLYPVGNSIFSTFLFIIFKVFGFSFYPVYIFQILLSMVSGILMFKIGKILGDEKQGLLAFILYNFFGCIYIYDLAIGKFSITLSLIVIVLHSTINLLKSRKSICKIFYFLISWFFLCKFRSMYYLFFIYILFTLAYQFFETKVRKFFLITIFTSLYIMLIIVTWYANSSQNRSHFAYHMYMSYNKYSTGTFMYLPHVRSFSQGHYIDADNISQKIKRDYKSFAYIDNFWMQKVFHFIFSNPITTSKLILKKIFYLFHAEEFLRKISHYEYYNINVRTLFFPINYYFLMPLIFMVIYLYLAKRVVISPFVFSFFLFQIISVSISVVVGFYKAQLIPSMVIIASYIINLKIERILIIKYLTTIYFVFYLTCRLLNIENSYKNLLSEEICRKKIHNKNLHNQLLLINNYRDYKYKKKFNDLQFITKLAKKLDFKFIYLDLLLSDKENFALNFKEIAKVYFELYQYEKAIKFINRHILANNEDHIDNHILMLYKKKYDESMDYRKY